MTLADMRINPGGDRSLAGPELPLELEDEFQTLTQEMQRYIKLLLNTRKSGNSVGGLSMVKLGLPRRARTLTSLPSCHDQRLNYAISASPVHETIYSMKSKDKPD